MSEDSENMITENSPAGDLGLVASEHLFKSALNSISDYIFVLDAEMRVLFLNNSFKSFLNDLQICSDLKKQNFESCFSFLPKDFISRFRHAVLAGIELHTEEKIIYEKRTFYFEIKMIPVYKDNQLQHIVTVVNDITFQKLAQMEKQKNTQYFRNVFELSPSGIVLTDLSLNLTLANIYFCELCEYEEFELAGKSLLDLLHNDDVNSLLQSVKDILAKRIKFSEIEIRIITKTKMQTEVLLKLSLVNDENGNPSHLLLLASDMTERNKNINSLKKAHQQLRTILDMLPGTITVMDTNKRIIDISGPMLAEIGPNVKRDDVIGKLCYEVFDKNLKDCDNCCALASLDQGKPVQRFHEIHSPSGQVGDYQLMANPLFDEDGKIWGVVEIAIDVTDLQNARQQLEELNASKDKFFSIIAHDLRSPILGFLGLSETLSKELSDLSLNQIKQVSKAMNNSAQNLYKLLENLLQWSRFKRGIMDYRPKLYNLRESADECYDIVIQRAKQRNIELVKNVDPNLTVFADKSLVNSVIRNLLFNAVKFTPDYGKIEISAEKTNERSILVSVADTGIGIDKKVMEKLFDIDRNTVVRGLNDEQGSGLGLVLCKEIIELHGGSLSAESILHKGSTFRFTLPEAAE